MRWVHPLPLAKLFKISESIVMQKHNDFDVYNKQLYESRAEYNFLKFLFHNKCIRNLYNFVTEI